MAGYTDIQAGLNEIFEGIEAIKLVLDEQPTKALRTNEAPAIFSVFDSARRAEDGAIIGMTYRTLHRLLIPWENNDQAEATARMFVNAIPAAFTAAISADPSLGGRLRGYAQITDIDGSSDLPLVNYGGVDYRAVDFFSEVEETGARGSGI